jgi:hypothetical protein
LFASQRCGCALLGLDFQSRRVKTSRKIKACFGWPIVIECFELARTLGPGGYLVIFEPGTNMAAWLFTILRNLFRSEYRKRRREVEDPDGFYAELLTSLPDQSSHLESDEFRRALELLPTDQRESLILIGVSPTRKPRKSVAAPLAPSKAGSTAPATDWRRSPRSRAPIISAPIKRPARWRDKPPVPGDGRNRRSCLISIRNA